MKGISAGAFTPADFANVPLRARLAVLLDRRPDLDVVHLATSLDESVRWSA